MTLVTLQQEYIDTVNSGIARWSHRPKNKYEVAGGHAGRIISGAHRKLDKALRKFGCFTDEQIRQMIKDAWDMAELERLADTE